MADKCKYCETAYSLSTYSGETYVNALRAILLSIDEREGSRSVGDKFLGKLLEHNTASNAKVTAIQMFASPNDLEGIVQLLNFCHGNASMRASSTEDEEIKRAWWGKCQMLYGQLRIKAIGNPEVNDFLKEFSVFYGNNKKPPISDSIKTLVGLGLLVAVFFVLHYLKIIE